MVVWILFEIFFNINPFFFPFKQYISAWDWTILLVNSSQKYLNKWKDIFLEHHDLTQI